MMKSSVIAKGFGLVLAFMPIIASAGALDQLDKSLRAAITDTTGVLQTTAILWLSSFVLIQFLVTQLGLLKSGADIEAIFGKLLGSLLWFGFCFYVMANGVDFIDKVSQGFITKAGQISGAGSFNAGAIIGKGANLAGDLIAGINKASGITDLFMPSILGGLLGLVIIATCALIAFKVFLINIEAMLIIMLAPLSFSFLGLNALKDQGIAPFKSLISLLYRIMFLAVILKAMGGMSDNLSNVIDSITSDSIDGIWSAVFAAVVGYVLLGFLAFKSDSLASNLASGSTNLGTGDVASAAALGAATGAALAAGGVASAGAAASGGKSMSDVMKNMMGGGGSVSNATSGSGSGPVGQPPANPVNMSTSGAGSGSSGGAPRLPETGGVSSGPSPAEIAAGGSTDAGNIAPANSDSTRSPKPASPAETAAGGGNAGSGATAGIGGAGSPLEKQLSDLVQALNQPKDAAKPSFGDRMGALNQQVAQEKAATHVSISTHSAD